MSLFHVSTTKKTIVDGIEYQATIKKDITINFSAANYTVKVQESARDFAKRDFGVVSIKLIPDNMDFLHELTNIFPLADYNIEIMQGVFRHNVPHTSISFDIYDKKSGNKVYFAENVVLSDDDYDYIRDILIREVPQYDWYTAEDYLRSSIKRCIDDDEDADMLTDDAWNYLSCMTSARYKEFKTNNYVDFDFDLMKTVSQEILEDALRKAFELQKEDK